MNINYVGIFIYKLYFIDLPFKLNINKKLKVVNESDRAYDTNHFHRAARVKSRNLGLARAGMSFFVIPSHAKEIESKKIMSTTLLHIMHSIICTRNQNKYIEIYRSK